MPLIGPRANATLSRSIVPLTGLLGAGIGGAAVARSSTYALVFVALPLSIVLIVSVRARVGTVIIGGLFVLQSADQVGPSKIAYGAILFFCALVSINELRRRRVLQSPILIPIWVSGIVFAIALTSSAVLSPYGFDPVATVRSSLPYLMVLLAPIFALDAGSSLHRGEIVRAIGILGTIAAVAFAVDWLNRRGVSSLPIDKIFASSFLLPSLAFAFALVFASQRVSIRSLLWLIPLVMVPISLLLTGTRSALIVFASVLAVIGRRKSGRVTPINLVRVLATSVAIAIPLFTLLAPLVLSDPAFLTYRLQALINASNNGVSGDASLQERAAAQAYALQVIHSAPFLGVGPSFEPVQTSAFDTALSTPARLGWVGTASLVVFLVVTVFVLLKGARRNYRDRQVVPALYGWITVVITYVLIGSPLEDRGFAFALILGLAAIVAEPRSDLAGQGLPSGSPFALYPRSFAAVPSVRQETTDRKQR